MERSTIPLRFFCAFAFFAVSSTLGFSASAQEDGSWKRTPDQPAQYYQLVGPPPLDPAAVKAEKRRKKQILKLHKIMAAEGADFSQVKYDRYMARFGGGLALVIVGGFALVGSLLSAGAAFSEGVNWGSHEGPDPEEEAAARKYRITAYVLMACGIISLGTGIPIMILGSKGRRRQNYLRRKDQILEGYPTAKVALSLYGDPLTKSGGMAMTLVF